MVATEELLRSLHPERDYEQMFLMLQQEFPTPMALAMADLTLRTFCVPAMSRLMVETGEFTRRGVKRMVDTSILQSQWDRNGLDSPEGRAALSRVNRIHARYDIAAEHFTFVLAVDTVIPIRYAERYGWRRITPAEKAAMHAFRAEQGRRMNIQDFPPTYDQTARFLDEYEQRTYAYTKANEELAVAAVAAILETAGLTGRSAALTRQLLLATIPPRVLEACGLPPVPRWQRRIADGLARAMSRADRRRRSTDDLDDLPAIKLLYPNGYRIPDLGPGE
ncbi:oxygenase MpaB family protein [Microlunatus speluncae]|uniref:oxygenase MpaB family protein n=1 Tax=Microlunatus speluncae TaxID=2594267 RepID=UPI00126633BF|nr:oxygenase MpaB family protein [Microlunatus speluncae]